MNKHVINALSSYEFTYEKYTAYGQIDGYEVNVLCRPLDIGPILIFSTYMSLEKKNAFINRIKSKRFSMVSASALEFGVVVTIGVMTPGGVEKKFKEVLPVILSLLDEFEAPKKDICPLSGIEMDDLVLVVIIDVIVLGQITEHGAVVHVVTVDQEMITVGITCSVHEQLAAFGVVAVKVGVQVLVVIIR